MLLIAEIILTVFAWRKGWRGLALLPGGIGMGLGFVAGMAVGAAGGRPEDLIGIALLIDGLSIAALVVMTARAPRNVEGDRLAEPFKASEEARV